MSPRVGTCILLDGGAKLWQPGKGGLAVVVSTGNHRKRQRSRVSKEEVQPILIETKKPTIQFSSDATNGKRSREDGGASIRR
ncbi:unnamed protein product [Clonostachys rosea f. rosea IK726]|uniref:Uncharacterized protein n=1 Tax=Clonostachys rosea f. rosea IK726 TaxID=1349383 RepID=A0ACA9TXD8_BIOOC|nr:unnamed protein product [Clonostachys rosea f. rosea IK726]